MKFKNRPDPLESIAMHGAKTMWLRYPVNSQYALIEMDRLLDLVKERYVTATDNN